MRGEPTRRTAAFFVLTFAITWTVWGLPFLLGWTHPLFVPGGPLFLLGVFAPGIVATLLTAWSGGVGAARRLLSRILQWNVPLRWYAFALCYMAATKLAAAAAHRVLVGTWPAFGDTPWILLFAGAVAFASVQAGEEVGWRGYALPRLAMRLGPAGAALVLGMIWAVWHLPLFLMPGTGSDGQSFPLYFSHVTALSVTMAWLYWKTGGSLLLVMLMHAAVNNTTGIVPAAVPGATDPFTFSASRLGWLTVAVAWAVALPQLYHMAGAGPSAVLSDLAGDALEARQRTRES